MTQKLNLRIFGITNNESEIRTWYFPITSLLDYRSLSLLGLIGGYWTNKWIKKWQPLQASRLTDRTAQNLLNMWKFMTQCNTNCRTNMAGICRSGRHASEHSVQWLGYGLDDRGSTTSRRK